MSNKLFGEIKGNYGIVKNRNSTIMDVPLDLPSYKNRRTEAQRLEKYLRDAGGWDEALCGEILVARLPSGEMIRYDGDHRTHMKRITHPAGTLIRAKVVDVSSYEEISKLFKMVNYSGRKNLLPEEIFIHDDSNSDLISSLKNVGAKIDIDTEEPGSVVGDLSGVTTKIHNFKGGIANFGEENMKLANSFILSCSPCSEYPAELMTGMACVFKQVNFSEKEIIHFEKWFKQCIDYRGSLRKVHSHAKKKGGMVNNKGSLSVAIGLLEEFYDTIDSFKFKTFKGKLNKAKSQIYYDLGLE